MLFSSLEGLIGHGRGKGARAGFPTANLTDVKGAYPPDGVYAVKALLKGREYLGVTNVGTRPTADDSSERTVETLLDGFSGDIYGERMSLCFFGYLRAIHPFPDMHALKTQIDRDMESARAMAKEAGLLLLSKSAKETARIGALLSRALCAGDIVLLDGDLGAGKSELARGVARGLGVTSPVPSPTFTILNVYDTGRLALYHFDWYRIEDEEELYEMGAQEQMYGSGVSLIEWPERGPDLIKGAYLDISIRACGEDSRCISITPRGGFRALPKSLFEDEGTC